jgi:hypothetical protein
MLEWRSSSKGRLSGAKARVRQRARERGAVMFIVAMTLAVIAAMGMYALNIAATEIKTAGFIREETQVHYLSEFGVLGAAQEITGAKTQFHLSKMITEPATGCASLHGVPSTAGALPLACRMMEVQTLGLTWVTPLPAQPLLLQPWTANNSEAARGSVGLPTAPGFYVELTDPTTRTAPPGYSLEQGLCFMGFTANSVGLSQVASGSFVSEGLETSRGRIVGGPIRCN